MLVELPPRARPDAPTAARARLGAWLVALIALLPHLRGLSGGFVYDDFRFVAENPGIQTLAHPAELVASVERMSRPLDRDIWRPLRTLLFSFEWRLFGNHPAGFHAVSLLLHLLVVRGVIALALRLPGIERSHAFAAGLLFGVHPITVESVAWISSQGDLLAATFVLASLLAAARRPVLASGLAALALLAKESALPLVALFVLAARWWREDARPRTRLALGVAALTALYLVARQHVVMRDWTLTSSGLGQRDASISQRLLQFAQNGALALRLFVWPRPLAVAYDDGFLPPARMADVLGALVKLAILALALLRTRESRVRTRFALAFALLFFLPTSGLLVALKVPLAERFLLLPLAGFAVGVAAQLPLARAPLYVVRATRLAVGLAAALLAAVTCTRTGDFHDDPTLWRAELAVHPTSVQAKLGLMHGASEAGDPAATEGWARRIIDTTLPGDPRRLAALAELGELAVDAHDEERALVLFEQCRAETVARGSVETVDPGLHRAWVALGDQARKRDGPAAGQRVLEEGVRLFGRQPRLLQGLGICRDLQEDAAGAETLYREALAAGDDSAQLRNLLARALVHQGRKAEARQELERALTLDPSDVSSRRILDELLH